MNILVTGGSGFIGRYLINNLLSYNFNITTTKRNSKNKFLFDSRINILNKGLEEIDIKDLRNIEIVVHFACKGVSPKKASFKELEKINVQESYRIIKLACDAGVRRFVMAGSCLEYGEEANNWDYIPPNAILKPICEYSKSKAKAFMILNEFAKVNDIEFFYGRIFSAYGEGQFERNFWPLLRKAALTGKNFKMTMGDQIRDFIKVEKVACHFTNAILRNDIHIYNHLVVNVGSGKGITLKEFATKEWKKFNASGKLIIGGLQSREGEILRMVANTKDLKSSSNF